MWALAAPPASKFSTAVSALSVNQARAVLALARGGTISSAADAIGVHRSCIYRWFKSDPNFKHAIEEIRREWNERVIDEVRLLQSLAVLRLRHILESGSAAEPPTFDTIRHFSTLLGISGAETRPPRHI